LEKDKHIFLIGFMGSGKTSLGKLVAKNFKLEFIDTDRFIEKQENSKIQEIFDEKGENYFRKLEHEFILNLPQFIKPTVFSTGGGMPIYNDNLSIMKKHGIVVFLDITIGKLHSRLKNDKKRPLLQVDENLYEFITREFNVRLPIYSQAHIIENAGIKKNEIVVNLLSKINSFKFSNES